jgi:membrane-associated protease RseP (regulator of RpoE activity)
MVTGETTNADALVKPGWLEWLAVLVVAWGLVAAVMLPTRGEAGYTVDAGNQVLQVLPGSAAEAAGILAGDRIREIGGQPVEDSRAMAVLGQPKAGTQRNLLLEREGQPLELTVNYQSPGTGRVMGRWLSFLLGCGFVGFTILAWRRRPANRTKVLAIMGLGLGLAFMGDPAIATWPWRGVLLVLRHGLVLAGIGAVLHFLLLFPEPRAFLRNPRNILWLYLPLGFFWQLLAWRILFSPSATGLLNSLTFIGGSFLFGMYFVVAVTTMTRSYIRSRTLPVPDGSKKIFFSTLAGLLPLMAYAVLRAAAPESMPPGADYWFIALVLLPWGWSAAAISSNTLIDDVGSHEH